MSRPLTFVNHVVFMLPAASFTDVYQGTPWRGFTFVLSNLGSSVPVYAGHFHVSVYGDDHVRGFYMLSRVPVTLMPDRAVAPRIGVPIIPEGSTWIRTGLPEKLAEFIGSGLLCDPKYDTGQSDLDVSVVYKIHLQDALMLTFVVDFSAIADFNALCVFRFSSTLRV